MTHTTLSATASSLWESTRDTISGNATLLCGGVAASMLSAWAGWKLAGRMTAATCIVPPGPESATEAEAEVEAESDPEETETVTKKPHAKPQTVDDELAEEWIQTAHQYRVLYNGILTSPLTQPDKDRRYGEADKLVIAHLGLQLQNLTGTDATSMAILAPFRQFCEDDTTFLAGMTKQGVFEKPLIKSTLEAIKQDESLCQRTAERMAQLWEAHGCASRGGE